MSQIREHACRLPILQFQIFLGSASQHWQVNETSEENSWASCNVDILISGYHDILLIHALRLYYSIDIYDYALIIYDQIAIAA